MGYDFTITMKKITVQLLFFTCLSWGLMIDNVIAHDIEKEKTQLANALAACKSDSCKIFIYYDLSKYFTFKNYDSCHFYAEKVLTLSQQTHFVYGEGLGYQMKADASFGRGDFSDAIQFYLKALNVLSTQSPSPTLLIDIYSQLTTAYAEIMDYTSGEDYVKKSIALSQKHDSVYGLSVAYNNYGDLLDKQKKYKEALVYYEKSLSISRRHKLAVNTAFATYNIGYVNNMLGNHTLARTYLTEARQISKQEGDVEGEIYALIELGRVHLALQQVQVAKQFSDSARVLFHHYPNLKLLKDNYALLVAIFAKQGKYDSAYVYQVKTSAIKDTIFNEFQHKLVYALTTNQKINLLENSAFEKEKQLFRQRKKNNWLMLIGGVLLIGFLGLYVLNRKSREYNAALKRKNDQIEQQKTELSSLNEAKSKLISIISHDLRAPLNQINALFQLLHSEALSPQEFKAVASKVDKQIGIVSENLEQSLQWISMQANGVEASKEKVVLHEKVSKLVNTFEASLQVKEIEVNNQVHPNLILTTQPEHLGIALRNLMSNAIKFSHKGGKIHILAKESPSELRISIADEGVGISNKNIKDILNPNKKHSTNGTMNEKGTGLGLQLSMEYLEQIGGRIEVESNLGQGAIFTIIVPHVV